VISSGIDTDALVAGFIFGAAVTVAIWVAVVGVALVRKLLSEAGE
jgi:hypothetical protein